MRDLDIEEFETLKKQIQAEYKKIGCLFSPALQANINFNSDGFYHLQYKNNRLERSILVQRNKFMCLNDAVKILKKSTTIQEYRRGMCTIGKTDIEGFQKNKIVEWFGFFAIINFTKSIRVKVIIRRVGGEHGQYHFWSVMPFWKLSNGQRMAANKDMFDE